MAMDYRNIFDRALNEAQTLSQLPDDDRFIQIVKERTSNMEKKDHKIKKPVVIAASVAAAAALTVSVGAAVNWDLTSLFAQNNEALREERDHLRDMARNTENVPFNISMPNGASRNATDPQREHEILQSLSHDLNETVEYDDYILHFSGYSFDGGTVNMLYDIHYKEGIDINSLTENTHENQMIKHPFSISLFDENGDNIVSGGGPFNDPNDIYQWSFEQFLMHPLTSGKCIVKVHDLRPITGTGKPISAAPEVMSFELDLSATDVKYIELDTDISGTSSNGLNINVNHIRLSPLNITLKLTSGINIYNDQERLRTFHQMPLYITYNDGTVLDISGYGNFSVSWQEEKDSRSHTLWISTAGNILDIENIKSIQIFNDVIELDTQ